MEVATTLLAEHYGLTAARLTRTEHGVLGETYLVEAGADRFFFKRYVPGMYPREQIRWACAVQGRLSRADLPVPPLIANRHGQDLTETDAECCLLMPWLPGRIHERGAIPGPAARALGATLGRLHAELARLEPVKPYSVANPAAATQSLHGLLLEAERRDDPLDAVAARLLRRKLAMIERLAPEVPRFAALPTQWVHGDYQETNVLFADDGSVTGVLDFDALRCRPRGNEVMRTLSICFPPLATESLGFFRAYAEVTRPAAGEVVLYAPLGAYIAAISAWPLLERYREPELYQPRWDRFIQERPSWWQLDLQRLTDELLTQPAP